MPKQCSHINCSYNVFSRGLCQYHWRGQYGKPIAKRTATGPYKHPILTQTISGLPAKPIKPISDKQAKRLAKYRIARDEYFRDYPVCQYQGCSSTDITLHHGAGKIGNLLWNKKYFKSLCWPHHRIVEGSPLEAKILQLSFDRLDK